MGNREIAEIVFKEELDHIGSPQIRSFTLQCFEKLTADYCWLFTASSSQKHHPKISNKPHGIVLHTKLAVWWGRKFADMYDKVGDEVDIIVTIDFVSPKDTRDLHFGEERYQRTYVIDEDGDEIAMTFLLGLGSHGDVRTTTLRAFTREEFTEAVKRLP